MGNWNQRMKTMPYQISQIVYNNFGFNINVSVQSNRQAKAPESELKTILFWNAAYGGKEYNTGFGRRNFYRYNCPETRCYATANRSYLPLEEFDAILLHQRGIEWNDMPDPKRRSPKQRFIMWVVESASYPYMDVNRINNYFNWTMTYREDSDIYRPYGYIVKVRDHPEGEDLKRFIEKFGVDNAEKFAANRTKMAAWFVSNCYSKSNREGYVKELRKHTTVDIYGGCGKFECSRKVQSDCMDMLERDYRFYLAFENSLCKDYVTEKFFRTYSHNIIPVTFNLGNLTGKGAPPNSFIDSLSFQSSKKLAEYFDYLTENKAKYAEYFWWKDFYEIRHGAAQHNMQPSCKLCEMLNNESQPATTYPNMKKWWVDEAHCKRWNTLQ